MVRFSGDNHMLHNCMNKGVNETGIVSLPPPLLLLLPPL